MKEGMVLEETKAEGKSFEPTQIIATENIDETTIQNWIGYLPRLSDHCSMKITGNSVVITPVEIKEYYERGLISPFTLFLILYLCSV